MAEFPALPLWTDAYLGDTTHLTTIEHGAYLLLLIVMWRAKDNRLPCDDAKLARYAKLTPGQWARIKPTIIEFFHVENGFIIQGRLTDEATLVRRNSKKQSNNARSRWLKEKENVYATADPKDCQPDAPTTTPTTTLDSSNDESPPTPQGEGGAEPDQPDAAQGEADIFAEGGTAPEPADPAGAAFDAWNVTAERMGNPHATKLTRSRRAAINARLKEVGPEGWARALANAEASSFCRGAGDRGWKLIIDNLVRPDLFHKLHDGGFADRTPKGDPHASRPQTRERRSFADEVRDNAAAVAASRSREVAPGGGAAGYGDGPIIEGDFDRL